MKIKNDDGLLIYEESGDMIEPLFDPEEWDAETFKDANIKGYAPMLAKEISDDDKKEDAYNNQDYIVEEKFDGTRGLMYFFSQPTEDEDVELGYCRIFSRRISVKTGFYVENSDSLPHLRDLDIPELDGTIIDGELFIDNQPFKEVSSTLNCLWDKAINRQLEKGFITFHAFDIIKYKGVDLRRVPLLKRKKFLHKVIEKVNDKYLVEVPYYPCGKYFSFNVSDFLQSRNIEKKKFLEKLYSNKEEYSALYKKLKEYNPFSAKAYYELIVATGGEGVIIKPLDGKYKCDKRQGEYLKIKKFFTRDCIIMGFTEPTREYDGKFPKDRWDYWVNQYDNRLPVSKAKSISAKELIREGYTPVTRFYYNKLVGDLRVGVIITDEEIEKLPKDKKFNIVELGINSKPYKVIEVGDLQGFDDKMRYDFSFTWYDKSNDSYHMIPPTNEKEWEEVSNSDNWERYSFKKDVVEIKSNEVFSNTGKMRHPRFMRMRYDKSAEECVWSTHVE